MAQPVHLVFEHFNTDNGLPQNSVNYIMQDSKGFIWICTQDGLCRYDGYQFKIYRHNPNSRNTLSNNYVWQIIEDSKGIFWIATFGGGVNRFDPATETFTHYKWVKDNPKSITSNNIFSLLDGGNSIFIGTGDGFCKMDKNTGLAERYLKTPGNTEDIAGNFIGSVTFARPGFIWMKSDSGLTQFNVSSNEIQFLKDREELDKIDFKSVITAHKFGNDIYLVNGDGITVVNAVTNSFKQLIKKSDLKELDHFLIQGILPSDGGKYWINTNRGLVLFESQSGLIRYFRHNPAEPSSISNDNVLRVFKSVSGVLWLGTRGGLDKLEREIPNFPLITKQIGETNTLSHPQISGIAQDRYGRLWLGTADGVNVYDRSENTYYVFNTKTKGGQKLSANYILDVYGDKEGNIWIGTKAGGLNKIVPDPDSKDLAKARVVQYPVNNVNIQSICPGKGDTLWLGTSGGGMVLFNKSSGKTKVFPQAKDGSGPNHPYIFYIFIDSFENIWLGTASGGVNLFDPNTSRFVYLSKLEDNPYSLSNNIVLSIFEDSKHQLWIGTTGGLNKLTFPLRKGLVDYFEDSAHLETDSLFTVFNQTNGLPNDMIYGILEDDHGFFWISTNKGLVKFNPEIDKPVIKTFDISNGLQSNEFNQNAFYKNHNGEMFFGGLGGLNIFHPDSVKENKYVPPVYITDFKLYNASVPLVSDSTDESFQLEKVIFRTDRIELEYHHDVITFDFAALNFINPEKNGYKYKLKGFNRSWINSGTIRSATYTNLDPGNYVFRVKASNDEGIWNEKGASIIVVVPPPPWFSWYAFLIYIVITVIVLYLFFRQRIRVATRKLEMEAKIEQARMEARENFRIRISQDFHDEAGNKITKINLFTELARSEKNVKYQKYLDKIAKNTREISVGMRDFIWALDPGKDTLLDTLLRLQEFGDSMFTEAGTPFQINGIKPGFNLVKLNMDTRRAIVLIFKEAMNNCAKYADAKNVCLNVSLEGFRITLQLQDDGNGFNIDRSSKKISYGIRNMKSRAEKLNAYFDIFSEIGKGCSITLELEIPQMGY